MPTSHSLQSFENVFQQNSRSLFISHIFPKWIRLGQTGGLIFLGIRQVWEGCGFFCRFLALERTFNTWWGIIPNIRARTWLLSLIPQLEPTKSKRNRAYSFCEFRPCHSGARRMVRISWPDSPASWSACWMSYDGSAATSGGIAGNGIFPMNDS
jgi:hypothetical protein